MKKVGRVNLSELQKPKRQGLFDEKKETKTPKTPIAKKAVKKKKNLGRPKKDDSEKLSVQITVNLTKADKKKLEVIAKERYEMPLPKLIRGLLQENKII